MITLYGSSFSPYVRFVRMIFMAKGLGDQVTLTLVDPHAVPAELLPVNPLSKVPAIEIDEGPALYDSRAIMAWLERTYPEPPLTEEDDNQWLHGLRRTTLALGTIDAAVDLVMDRRRDEAMQSKPMQEKWLERLTRAVDALERDVPHYPVEDRYEHFATGAALGYLDLRIKELDWREGRQNIRSFYEDFSSREEMLLTAPPAA